jgi:hypothetical protein
MHCLLTRTLGFNQIAGSPPRYLGGRQISGAHTLQNLRHDPTYAAVEAGWHSEMRDELRMDYIERLKRAAILLGIIVVCSSGAALAQDQLTKADLVQLVVTLGVYDNRCEKLAPRLLADLQRMVRMLNKDDVMAGVINEQEKVDRAGEAKWCDALRPVVEKYKNGLFEPTRP